MVAVPAEIPVTTPLALTLVTDEALLLQVPPYVASVNVIVCPIQTPVGPVMGVKG